MECVADRYVVWQELMETQQLQRNNYNNQGYYHNNNIYHHSGHTSRLVVEPPITSTTLHIALHHSVHVHTTSKSTLSRTSMPIKPPLKHTSPNSRPRQPNPISISPVLGNPPNRTNAMCGLPTDDHGTTTRLLSKSNSNQLPAVHHMLIMLTPDRVAD